MLHERGWIELVRTRPRRGATEHFYRSVGPVYIEDDEWEQVAPSLRRAVTLDTLRITSDEAKAAAFAGGFDDATAHLSRTVLELDARGVTDLAAKLRDVMRDVEKIVAAARERSRDGRERHEVVIQYFRVPPTD